MDYGTVNNLSIRVGKKEDEAHLSVTGLALAWWCPVLMVDGEFSDVPLTRYQIVVLQLAGGHSIISCTSMGVLLFPIDLPGLGLLSASGRQLPNVSECLLQPAEQRSSVSYLLAFIVTESLHRDRLEGGLAAILQRQHLLAALLQGLHHIIILVPGLLLVLAKETVKMQVNRRRDKLAKTSWKTTQAITKRRVPIWCHSAQVEARNSLFVPKQRPFT